MSAALRLVAAATLLVGAGCSEGSTGVPNPPSGSGSPATVTVSFGSTLVEVGGQTTATAVVRDADGNTLGGMQVGWSTSNASVATIDGAGTVTAVSAGTARITATVGGRSGNAPVFVVAPAVATIEIVFSDATLFNTGTVRANAIVRNSQGGAVTSQPIVWTSSSTAVATVTANGTVFLIGPGVATIRAEAGTVTGERVLTVPPVVHLSIAGSARAKLGDLKPFEVDAFAANGMFMAFPVTWSLADPTSGVVSPLGIRPTRLGVMTVRATVAGVSTSRDIEIYDWIMTGSGANITATLPADDDLTGAWAQYGVPTLELSCSNGALAARINSPWTGGAAAVSVGYYSDWSLFYDESWIGGANTITHPGPGDTVRDFMQELLASEFMAFVYTHAGPGGVQHLMFRLAGAQERIPLVLEACP